MVKSFLLKNDNQLIKISGKASTVWLVYFFFGSKNVKVVKNRDLQYKYPFFKTSVFTHIQALYSGYL